MARFSYILACMRTVSLVLDIQTQSLDSLYTYVVPADMVGVEVGCAVLVEFGARRAIGYVMEVCERPDSEIDPTSVSPPQAAALGAFFAILRRRRRSTRPIYRP